MDGRVTGYAQAILDLATAEGELERVETEFLAISQAFDKSEELRSALTNPSLPLERKRAILKSQRQRYERWGLYLLQDDLGTVMPDAQLSPAKRLWLRFLLWNDDAELYDYSYSVGYALFTEAQANRISAETVLRHPPADLNEVLSPADYLGRLKTARPRPRRR